MAGVSLLLWFEDAEDAEGSDFASDTDLIVTTLLFAPGSKAHCEIEKLPRS